MTARSPHPGGAVPGTHSSEPAATGARPRGLNRGPPTQTGIHSRKRPKGRDRGVVTAGERGGGMRRLSRGAPPAWYRAPGAPAPNLLAHAPASVPNQPATSDRRHAAPAMPALMRVRGVEQRGAHLPACSRHRRRVPPTIISYHGGIRGTTTRGASTG